MSATKVTACLDEKSTTVLFPSRMGLNLAYWERASPQHSKVYGKGNELITLEQSLIPSQFTAWQFPGWKGAVHCQLHWWSNGETETILPTTQKKYLDDLYLVNPDVFLNTEVSKLLPNWQCLLIMFLQFSKEILSQLFCVFIFCCFVNLHIHLKYNDTENVEVV